MVIKIYNSVFVIAPESFHYSYKITSVILIVSIQ